MVNNAAEGQQIELPQEPPPKRSPAAEDHKRQKIISFKVTHVLLTFFFLWLM